jgi:hypothetical protein
MALMLGMITPTVVTAEPQVLADHQLDAVTAAGVLVAVNSVANAVGDHVVADTSSFTSARSGHLVEVGVGFSDGYATACCGQESDVVLDSTAVGAGDLVYGRTYTVEFRGAIYTVDNGFGYFAYGYTAAFLLAVSFEDAFEMVQQTVQEPQADIRDLVAAAREFTGASRDGFATGFELGAAIAAGTRWQAAQDLVAGYQDARQLSSDARISFSEMQ